MLKVAVFDSGWGGELVANYLMDELKMIEFVRIIDWRYAPYGDKSFEEICQRARSVLEPYIGKFDAIILGGYVVSSTVEFLRSAYPVQKFVPMPLSCTAFTKRRSIPSEVAVFMSELVRKSHIYQTFIQELSDYFPTTHFTIADTAGWETKIDEEGISSDDLRRALENNFCFGRSSARQRQAERRRIKAAKSMPLIVSLRQQVGPAVKSSVKFSTEPSVFGESNQAIPLTVASPERVHPDTVLLLNTHFWDIKPELERLFGWDTHFIDFRKELLHDVCAALKLRGVDGLRHK